MPLTKEEVIERCDQLIERYKNLPPTTDVMVVSIVGYISLSSVFKDITTEESVELIEIYLEKIRALAQFNARVLMARRVLKPEREL